MRIFKSVIMGIITSSILIACDGGGTWGESTPSATILSESGIGSCSCPSSYYYLKNTSNKKIKVTYKHVRRVPLNSNHRDNSSKTRTVTLGANSRRNLGCGKIGRSDATAGQLNCDVTQSWNVLNTNSAFYRIEDVMIASKEINNINLSSIVIDCRKECLFPKEAQGYCEIISGDSIPEKKKRNIANTLAELSINTGINISKTDLMDRFEVQDDPCDRGDLFVSKGMLKNKGKYACSLKMSYLIGKNDDFDALFSFPVEVEGNVNYSDGIIVNFDDAKKAPWIKFKDMEIDSEFGGSVLKVENAVSREMFIISTENGCLGFGYE